MNTFRDTLAVIGLLCILWSILVRLLPDLAEWRSAELYAWSVATRQTSKRLLIVWRLHWRTYKAFKGA